MRSKSIDLIFVIQKGFLGFPLVCKCVLQVANAQSLQILPVLEGSAVLCTGSLNHDCVSFFVGPCGAVNSMSGFQTLIPGPAI